MSRLVLAYDADCGPCTRFKRLVEFIDTKNQVDFIPLIEADESGLLDEIPRSERHASFHLVQPGGEILNGAAAIPSLIKILPLGKAIAKVITSAPGGPRSISFVYAGFSRLHDRGSCRYQRSFASSKVGFAERVSKGLSIAGPLRSKYVYAGLIGGFLGSLASDLHALASHKFFVETSLAAHVVFGLVLDVTLSVGLSGSCGQANEHW